MTRGQATTDRRRIVLVTDDGRAAGRWIGDVMSADLLTGPFDQLGPDDLVVLCPVGVEPFDDAEAAIREMAVHQPDLDLAYTDSVQGEPAAAESCLRPAFSPDRLADQHYLGPLLILRWAIVGEHRRAGGQLDLRPDRVELDQLACRSGTIAHLPQLLYRADEPGASAVSRSARRPLRRPLVSIVMPTMGASRQFAGRTVTLAIQAIESLIERTDYDPIEIIPVLTPGTPDRLVARMQAVLDRVQASDRPALRPRPDGRPFNFSNACNQGALTARGEVLLFLNDDTAAVSGDWLDRMVALATDPEIGAVGARLLYGDGSIQHAGIWSRGGHPVHRYEGFRAGHPGHLRSLTVAQNCLAVTGACLAVETTKFMQAGGFSPEFPSSYNDVDLCLKLDAIGYRTVVEPGAVLHHYEASTRDPVIGDWEIELLHRRWRRQLIADPYDNPNHLTPGAEEFPSPDPTIAVERQRNGRYRHPARIWTRSGPVADLTESADGNPKIPKRSTPAAGKERHVV